MLDLTFPIPLGFVLSKKAWTTLCKTSPDPIWMAWSGFGQMDPVQQQAGVQQSSGLVLAECNRSTTSFPLSDSAVFFHMAYMAQIILCKTSLDPI